MILFTSCFLKHHLFIIYLKQSKLCFILFYRHWLWLEIGDYPNLRCTCILMKIVYCVLIQGQGNAHLYHTGIYVMWLVVGNWWLAWFSLYVYTSEDSVLHVYPETEKRTLVSYHTIPSQMPHGVWILILGSIWCDLWLVIGDWPDFRCTCILVKKKR